MTATWDNVPIQELKVSAYTIPTDVPEADGTIEWDSTTMVLVQVTAAGKTGIGYSYAHAAAAQVIDKTLKDIIVGKNALHIPSLTWAMCRTIRNNGNSGIAMMAVSAVDIALWDLKSKIMELPLALMLGMAKEEMLLYGSGGFTSYSNEQVARQFTGWANYGIKCFKMKIGTHIEDDVNRVRSARGAIGNEALLFVDANGAYTVRQALDKAESFEHYGVTWFEEPVPADDLAGLRFIREHVPLSVNIAAGEYGYHLHYFENMIHAGAIDVLQGDATRCGGITGFLKAGHLCEAHGLPYSSHCAPAVHLHAALALPSFYIAEYFYDHARIEEIFFDGITRPANGVLKPELSLPGLGLILKERDIEKYRV